jgi:hypothetical protein
MAISIAAYNLSPTNRRDGDAMSTNKILVAFYLSGFLSYLAYLAKSESSQIVFMAFNVFFFVCYMIRHWGENR